MPVTASDVERVLVRHDPLGAWQRGHDESYSSAAQTIAARLPRVLGLGHVITVTADVLDRSRAGLYRTFRREPDGELGRRLVRVGRELWDARGVGVAAAPASAPSGHGVLTPLTAPPAAVDTHALDGWLVNVEARLEVLPPSMRSSESRTAQDFRRQLPAILDDYAQAGEADRTAIRDAFSRNLRVLHQVSRYAGACLARLQTATSDAEANVRAGLLAESLLDMGTDWRDELMALQKAREDAAIQGLPFAPLVAEAAALSSERTARFLMQLTS